MVRLHCRSRVSLCSTRATKKVEGSGTPANADPHPPHLAMRLAPCGALICRRSTADASENERVGTALCAFARPTLASASQPWPSNLSVVCLGGRRSAPERTGIGSVSMKRHHPVEQFAHGRGLLVEAHEVPEVTARFLDDPRVVFVLGSFVAGDHGAGFQRFELVEGGDPFEPGMRVALRHVGMDA